MIEFITNNDPIRKINTKEVLLSEREVYLSAEQGVLNAFKAKMIAEYADKFLIILHKSEIK